MRTTTAVPQEERHTTHRWNAHSTEGATVTVRTIEIPAREVQVGDLVTTATDVRFGTSGLPVFWVTGIVPSTPSLQSEPGYWWTTTYCSASANDHEETDTWMAADAPVHIVDTIG
jgi:hypothetical protein